MNGFLASIECIYSLTIGYIIDRRRYYIWKTLLKQAYNEAGKAPPPKNLF